MELLGYVSHNISTQPFCEFLRILPDTNFCERWDEEFFKLITPFSWRPELKESSNGSTISFWYRFFLVIFQAIIYIQIPLLVMAVRRGFKR